MSRVFVVVACGFTLAACSTSLESPSPAPPKQSLWIESQPPGAEAKTSLGPSCRTPCGLEMQAADEFSLTLALKGYQPQTVSVRKDEADSSKLAPNPIKVELQPVKKRAALKKKPAVAAKPAPAQAASAQPTQPPWPTAAPAAPTPAVEAAAATNR
jgi:hypothetical protein